MPRGHHSGRRALTVLAVCAVAAALPIGVAEAVSTRSTAPSPDAVISITDCGSGLTITLGGGSLVGINLPGDDCPTGSATATGSASGTATASPSQSPTASASASAPASASASSSASGSSISTLPPPPTTPLVGRAPASTAAPASNPAAPSPIPQAPQPSPSSTHARTTPGATASAMLYVPSATPFHAVPFKRLSTVAVVLIVAIVPVSIARIRHRHRRR